MQGNLSYHTERTRKAQRNRNQKETPCLKVHTSSIKSKNVLHKPKIQDQEINHQALLQSSLKKILTLQKPIPLFPRRSKASVNEPSFTQPAYSYSGTNRIHGNLRKSVAYLQSSSLMYLQHMSKGQKQDISNKENRNAIKKTY